MKHCFLILIWPSYFCVGFKLYKIISSILKHFSLSYLLQIISVPILQIENWREGRVINFKLHHCGHGRDSELPFSHEVQCSSVALCSLSDGMSYSHVDIIFNGKQEGISQTIISIHNHILNTCHITMLNFKVINSEFLHDPCLQRKYELNIFLFTHLTLSDVYGSHVLWHKRWYFLWHYLVFTSQIYFDMKMYKEAKIKEEVVEYVIFYFLCMACWY